MQNPFASQDQKHEKYRRLLDRCKSLSPTPTAVAHPCDDASLRAFIQHLMSNRNSYKRFATIPTKVSPQKLLTVSIDAEPLGVFST
jgi:hypothetical protein